MGTLLYIAFGAAFLGFAISLAVLVKLVFARNIR